MEKTREDYINDMLKYGADNEEAENAYALFVLLKPALKMKNGRIDTAYGDKTPLGLYRMIGSEVFSK